MTNIYIIRIPPLLRPKRRLMLSRDRFARQLLDVRLGPA